MQSRRRAVRLWTVALLILGPVLFDGCGSKSKSPDTATPAATEAAASGAVDLAPETLEALVAPIALYPDVVIGHVLLAATNPQEVLDAGNWLLEHADLSPAALDKQAADLGMSTSMRALLPFPETVDMMCREIEWTTDLGAAFAADQAAVLDAVQRMRAQAVDVGNLATSEQLKVETITTEGKQAITIAPPRPEVIYVPKYDPVAVYAPAPAAIPPPTQTVVVEEKSSSSNAVVTGLLCFTAGVLIADAMHDDYYGYAPHYGYGGMYYGGHPYYPPPPYMYRPPYGGGYYPAHGYHPPPNYNHNFNNNTIIINQGDNNYWNNDFGGGGDGGGGGGGSKPKSPITTAKPNRPEMAQLDKQGQERTRKAAQQGKPSTREAGGTIQATRPANSAAKAPVKGTYAGTEKARTQNVANAKTTLGAKPETAKAPSTLGAKSAAAIRPTGPASESKGAVDRGYTGKSGSASAAKAPTAATASRPTAAKPAASRPTSSTTSRPSPSGGGGSAFSGTSNGGAERAASARGRASTASSGARASGGGGSRSGGRSR